MDMDLSMDIHVKSVDMDMDMDGKFHIHGNPGFTALWILTGTTRVSQYPKKRSPTHTYYGHQSSLICFVHLLQSLASSCSIYMPESLFA